jgi:hypothetical protein
VGEHDGLIAESHQTTQPHRRRCPETRAGAMRLSDPRR